MTSDIECAFIQTKNGVPEREPFYRAWDGLKKLSVACHFFDEGQLQRGELPLSRRTLVVGGIPVMEAATKQLGVQLPPADNLPECLAKYRGRRIWTSTWGQLRAEYGRRGPSEPLWVKPLRRNKGFPAIALYNADDIDGSSHLPDAYEVLVSEYVLFESEWRCFVRRGEILDLCRYQGDVFRYPDPNVIKAAVADFQPIAPAGYGIDFGVLTDGRTVLVEANEGYSLNPYGLESVDYVELLIARWQQLMQ